MLQKQKRTVVQLVYTKFPESFWSFKKALELLDLKASMPPTGLATIAAMFPKENFDVLPIIDLNTESLTDEAILQADIIMFSAMIVQKDSLSEIIARVKLLGKPVAVGGPYATSYPDIVKNMGVDHLILNEAETTLPPFIEDWLAGAPKAVYDEDTLRHRTSVALTKEGKPILSHDNVTPIPLWKLLKLNSYASMAIQFSRGCPHKCEFCDVTKLYGNVPRAKNPAHLIAELESLWRNGWRGSVFIVDDNFIGNQRAVRKLLPLLDDWQKNHNFPFSFFTEASLDLANDDLKDIRKGMIEAGFDKVFCGIESTNAQVLEKMGKKQNRGDIGEKVRILQKDGLEVIAGFIIGSDSDLPTVFDDIFNFIQSEGIVIAMVGLLTALRGTALYNRLKHEGRLQTESSGNNTHQLSLNFTPKADENWIIDGYIGLLDRLYKPQNYYKRCQTLRKRRGRFLNNSAPLTRSRVSAALRIFYRNIIKFPDWEFIKFMFGTLLTVPRNLPMAIEQAVKLAHFKGITEETVRVHFYPKLAKTFMKKFRKRADELHGNLHKRLRGLDRLERDTVHRITRLYNSIDPEFRDGAELILEKFRRNLTACANKYRQIWQDLGTAK